MLGLLVVDFILMRFRTQSYSFRYADYLVRTKYLQAEVHKFVQKSGGAPVWDHFKLMEETKHSVKRHLEKQMAGYILGQVNQKVW